MFNKFRNLVRAHKITSTVVVLLLAIGAYYGYKDANVPVAVTKYVIQDATQGTIVSSVSGSGQVEPVTSIDVKPQETEMVTNVYVQPGDHVTQGQLLVQLDTTNEEKALTQAQLSLQSAQISLAKLQEISTSTIQDDEDAVTQEQEALASASTSAEVDYQTTFDTIASSFTDFQNLVLDLQNFNQGTDINKAQDDPDAFVNLMPSYLQAGTLPYRNTVQATYQTVVTAYAKNLLDYQATNRNSPPATISALLTESYNTAKDIGSAVQAVKGLLNYVVDNYPNQTTSTTSLPPITATFQTNFGNYTNTANTDITNLSNAENTITSDATNLSNDQISLNEKEASLQTDQAGPDPLDVQSQQISIEGQQLALQTAQENLADDSIRAPISGTISAVDAIVGEDVPSPAVTIVGDGDEATLTLNELDAAKVAVGQPATLTFDALPNLSLAGTVSEIDPVGTVSQGVVSYTVDISFVDTTGTATTTAEVKPGMTVTANIVTQVDQNVIVVPSAAVKTSGTTSYILEPSTPVSAAVLSASASGGTLLPAGTKMVPVTVTLTNDTQSEISSGVNVGDQIITQSITTAGTTAAATTGGTSAIRALTGGGGGGGFTGGGGGGFTGGGRAAAL